MREVQLETLRMTSFDTYLPLEAVDSVPTPSMDEEDRLMICEDEEQSDGGVDQFNSLDNIDMADTPLFGEHFT